MSRIGQLLLLISLGCPRPPEDPGYDIARLSASAYVDAAPLKVSDGGDAGAKEAREAGPMLGEPYCNEETEPDEEEPAPPADPDFPNCPTVEDGVFDKKITTNKRRLGDTQCCYRPIVTTRPQAPQRVRSRDYER